jgi:hypothetical protein
MISKDKQYRTRDGKEVRIYETDGIGVWAIHGAVKTDEGWWSTCWTEDGKATCSGFDASCRSDLIEVKPRIKRTIWINIFPTIVPSAVFPNKRDADFRGGNRIACVKVEIDCEEGEGL